MAILAQLQRFFSPHTARFDIQHLYIALVEHARNPVFYTELDVPDTLDGRFDMITLHMYLLLDRLKNVGEPTAEKTETGRVLVEAYLADMARSLRELSVGDTGVARRIQKMASALYGRLEAYTQAKNDDLALKEALKRNVYGTKQDVAEEKVVRLAVFVRASEAMLARLKDAEVTAERIQFPPV